MLVCFIIVKNRKYIQKLMAVIFLVSSLMVLCYGLDDSVQGV